MKTVFVFNFRTKAKETLFCPLPLQKTRNLDFESEGGLRDWVCRIQEANARQTNSLLELARLLAQVRISLPHGNWTILWRTWQTEIGFKKRKGEMLVAIGNGVEGLSAHNCARLPSALHILYHVARLGREKIEDLIVRGVIHPGLSLQEAKELSVKYPPERRRKTSRFKSHARVSRFAKYVQDNLGTWSQQERKSVAEKLAGLVAEIQAADWEMPAANQNAQVRGASASAWIQTAPAIQPDSIRQIL